MTDVKVEQIDREAAQALCASGWTHAIEAFARHRIAVREQVMGEIERWLWETDDDITGVLCRMNDRSELIAMLQAKFGGRGAS